MLDNEEHRTDILNRLKRAEGQLRGLQRMIADGESCVAVASQLAAARKALDSTHVRLTACYMEHEIRTQLGVEGQQSEALTRIIEEVQGLLGKLR